MLANVLSVVVARSRLRENPVRIGETEVSCSALLSRSLAICNSRTAGCLLGDYRPRLETPCNPPGTEIAFYLLSARLSEALRKDGSVEGAT